MDVVGSGSCLWIHSSARTSATPLNLQTASGRVYIFWRAEPSPLQHPDLRRRPTLRDVVIQAVGSAAPDLPLGEMTTKAANATTASRAPGYQDTPGRWKAYR